MMNNVPFTDAEIAEIKTAYKNYRHTGAKPRLKALWLYSTGKPIEKIAKMTGFSPNYIPVLLHRYRKGGIKAVIGTLRNEQRRNREKYVFTAEELAAIEHACSKTTEEWALRRLEVLRLRAKGVKDSEITKVTGYCRTSIRRLVRDYRECGLEIMASMPRTGKRVYSAHDCKLTEDQIVELRNAYSTAPNARVKNRINALLLRSGGNTIKQVAAKTGFCAAHVALLTRQYRQNGIAALLGKPRPPKPLFVAYKYGFTETQKAEIEAARTKELTPKAAVRLEVLWMRANEKSYGEIVAATGCQKTTISMILRQYNEKGLEFVIANHYQGRYKKPDDAR